MRALVVCAAPGDGQSALVAALAPAYDLVVAVDGGGGICLAAGVVPDVVVGDMDSLAEGDLARLSQKGSEVLRFPARKDESDLDLALCELSERGCDGVTITAALSGRLDHTLAAIAVAARHARLCPAFEDADVRAWILSTAGRDSLSLHGPGATVSVHAFGGPATVTEDGFTWPLERARLDAATSLGLSNRIVGPGDARVTIEDGVAVVVSARVGDDGPALAV